MPTCKYRPCCVLAIWLLLALSAGAFAAETKPSDDSKTKGYDCLFMGHSFFAPIAWEFASHPARCGFQEHRQRVVFHGGANGSPGRLWASDKDDVRRAKEWIATGEVDLMGLTFYPAVGSDVSDYQQWIDLAVRHNPETRFFIMSPWAKFQGKSFEQYRQETEKWHAAIHTLIDQLRTDNPKTTIFCIPQGRSMVALWRLFEQQQLPEVSAVMGPDNRDGRSCLFRDNLGHGGRVPIEMGALVWLAAIYDVDLSDYEWDTKIQTDLKSVAAKIVHEDVYARQTDPALSPGSGSCAPIVSDSVIFEETDGSVAIEAEHFYQQTLADMRAWHITSSRAVPGVSPDGDAAHLAGAAGGAYVEALPDTRRTHDDQLIRGQNFCNEPGKMVVLHYKVFFNTPGKYFVWARVHSTGTEDNGVHFGIDGQWPASGQRWQTTAKNRWHWDSRQRTDQVHAGEPFKLFLEISEPGLHELTIAMREDGFELDRFLLTTDREGVPPQGIGPPVRLRSGTLPEPFPRLDEDELCPLSETGRD